MAFEDTFNADISRRMIEAEDGEAFLDDELGKMRQRMLEMDKASRVMVEGYRQVIEGLKMAYPALDLQDPSIVGTPKRMARALLEMCSGLGCNDEKLFTETFPYEGSDQVIVVRDINFTSVCIHHFLPFRGKVHLGYLPRLDEKQRAEIVGISKLPRAVDSFAKRPLLQEQLANRLAEAICAELDPEGAMVVVEAQHGCVNCRGVKKEEASFVTVVVRGKFEQDAALRDEFLKICNR